MLEAAFPFALFFTLFCGMAWKIQKSERNVPPVIVGVFFATLLVVIVSFVGLLFELARS